MELQGLKYPRPLTHDLAASIIRGLGGTLQRVVITRLQENTYFAELVIQRGTEIVSVDARPSDSIAIALRLQAPLFTPNELLSASTIQVEENDEGEANSFESTESTHMTAEQLQEYLKKLKPEDLGRFNP
jgi:bifunctional DNase/RNase